RAGGRARPERAVARRGRRPLPRPLRAAHPRDGGRRDHPPRRLGHRGVRADRVRRPGRPARRAVVHRPGLPVAAARLRARRWRAAARRRRHRAGGRAAGRAAGRDRAGAHRRAVLRLARAPPEDGRDLMAVLDRPVHRVPGRPAFRARRVSLVWRPRYVLVFLLGVAVLVLSVAANVGRGEYPIAISDVLAVLFGGGEQSQQFIILELRLPRSLTGVLVGGALAVAGAITQSIARNPLASPDMIGLTAGASAAAVFVIVLGGGFGAVGGFLASAGLPMAAFLGGVATATAIYALAWRRGVHGFRLVLVGIGLQAMLLAIVHWLLVVAEVFEAARAHVLLNGSLNARGWEHVLPVSIALAVLLPAAFVLAHVLGASQYGDVTARGLGVPVNRARSLLLLVAVGLASVATASAGPIAFVALVSPQIAQRLVGGARPPIGMSLVVGAALTVISDLVARTAFGATELPVGIVTAV